MTREIIRRWSGLLAKFLSVQVLTQALGLASGLCLIWTLPKEEYAWFILASSWQGTLAVLADTGISMALMAIGGRIHEDRARTARLVVECVRVRKYLFLAVAAVVMPVLLSLLLKAGAGGVEAVLLVLLVAGCSYFNLGLSVYTTVPKLYSQYNRILWFDMVSGIGRLILIAVGAWLLPRALLPMAVTGIVILFQWQVIRRWVADTLPLDLSVRSEERMEIFSFMKTNAPNAIYYCLQGQVSLVLITWFGRTEQVAEVGALGRLAVIFSVFMGVVGNLLAPTFSRGTNRRKLLLQYGLIVGAFGALGGFFLGLAVGFPRLFLMVLGPHYLHLERELGWMVLSIVASNIVAAMWNLNSSRGWIRHMWIEIPLSIFLQMFFCLWLDLSTVRGVLILGCVASISNFLVNAFLSYNGFRSLWAKSMEPCPEQIS